MVSSTVLQLFLKKMRIPIDSLILFQTPPGGIFAVPQEIAVNVGLLARYTDLVAVEVVGLLGDFSVFVDRVSIGETACMRTTHALRQD